MSEERVCGLIIAHASLAAGLAAAVRQIAGVEEGALLTVSNEGRGPEQLLNSVRDAIGDAPAILFTDLAGGSCAFAARKLAIGRPATAVICGVNLPVLLDFVSHRHLPLDMLVARLVERGRTGISGTCSDEAVRADRALSR